MKPATVRLLQLLIFSILIGSCKKKSIDDYYARPSNLESPIYQVLQSKGTFQSFLALIDKAGYKTILSKAGYFTIFAPNDVAFTKFYQDRGIAGIENIDSSAARAIVQYLLVYNSETKETIDDFQSATGLIPDQAFRRRTSYYTGYYDDTSSNGQFVKAIQSNRNGNVNPYITGDNNNKYIPYFTEAYFNGKGLSAYDYNYFYSSSSYGGFNVGNAKVINANIIAENGVIHEIDQVVSPLPSIDEYLRSKPEYSEFKKLYDKYMVSFILNADATHNYQLLTNDNKQVFVKTYSSLLAFSPNNENFLKIQDNDAQQGSFTMFVPKNDVLLAYENNVLLEYYKSFDKAPPQVIADFLNAHMWLSPVWPSKFNTTLNFLGEEARFNPQVDIFDKKILSNGIFYGANKVQEANVFSSVFSRAYLDPKYFIMTTLLNSELRYVITTLSQKFTLFMMSDAVIRSAGYDYNSTTNVWSYKAPGSNITTTGESIRQNLLRILATGIIPEDLTSLSGQGTVEAYNNEDIKWNNKQVISVGTQDANQVVNVDSTRITKNGTVYYINGLLSFTSVNIGTHIKNLGGSSAATSDFNYFANYLINSALYNSTTGEILGTAAGTFYTVFVPSNTAITQAVKDGYLPGNKTTGVPSFGLNPVHTAAEKEQVNEFLLYHILNKRSLIPNGKDSGPFETLLKNSKGDVLPITIRNQVGSMQITDMFNRISNVVISKSNNLSNRTIIHLIDNYLKFTY